MIEHTDELTTLRAEVQALRTDLDALRGSTQLVGEDHVRPRADHVPPSVDPPSVAVGEERQSRRSMLRLAGAAAAGAAVLLVDRTPAAADNGLTLSNAGATTTLTSSATTGFHFKASDSSYATNSEVIQVSAGTTSRHCIRAFSNNITSTMFLKNDGIGSALLATSNSLGATATILNNVGPTLNLAVSPGKQRPGLRTGETHFAGGLDTDTQGDLWYCTQTSVSGAPGKWLKVAGPAVAGAFHAINPIRVYDSRRAVYTPNGLRAPQTSFVVPVRDSHDLVSGAVVTADVVPVGATAVAFNVTAVATTGTNFLAVAPGSAASYQASTLNWTGAGQTIANASISPVDSSRQVKVFIGSGTGSTHVIIDIQGYWM